MVSPASFSFSKARSKSKLNIGGTNLNVDKETVIYFNDAKEFVVAQRRVDIRTIYLLNPLSQLLSLVHQRADQLAELPKNNWINSKVWSTLAN